MDETHDTTRDVEPRERPVDTTTTTGEGETHATTGGAAAAGAITGGVIGLTAGPAGAAIGAIGGAIVGAASERLMHNEDDVATTRTDDTYVEHEPVERTSLDRPISDTVSPTLDQPTYSEGVGERTPLAVGTGATPTTTWEAVMPRYRERWQSRYGTTGGRWEDYEPAYSYGWNMRDRAEYRGRSWTDVEPEFQRDWSTRHPETPWDRARESVRETWEDVTT